MPTIYFPAFVNCEWEILEVHPTNRVFADPANRHGVFIDGRRYNDQQLFRTAEAARKWVEDKMPIAPDDIYTIEEILTIWSDLQKARRDCCV